LGRREFVALLGGAAAWPLAARAQQPAMPVMGFLHSDSRFQSTRAVQALHQGLAEAGYIDNQNLSVEYRWAEGRDERFPEFAAELVRHDELHCKPWQYPCVVAPDENCPYPKATSGAEWWPTAQSCATGNSITPDIKYPSMWRVRYPDGSLSDIVNLTRARDGARCLALAVLNTRETRVAASPIAQNAQGGDQPAFEVAA
jgi:hypothetical protein